MSFKSITREIERRMISQFMDIMVLTMMNSGINEIGGYDVITYIHERFHRLMSPGKVYSCLHFMEREDLLKGRHNGKKRVYTLTEQGRKTARVIQKAEDIILKSMSDLLRKNKH